MANFGLKKLMARILVAAGVLNVVIAVPLAISLKHTGIAVASLTTETFVLLAMFIALRRHGLHVFGGFDKGVDNHGTAA